MSEDDPLLQDSVAAARSARIVIMNPPFTNRSKMGEKFSSQIQRNMRLRTDGLESTVVRNDPEMAGFADKNSVRPLFVALADRCLDHTAGILAMISPTIALTTISGRHERIVLARRFHIHTLLTCHQPGQINLSQNTSINESIVIARRHAGARPPTRIVSLDRMPTDDREAAEFHQCLSGCATGIMPNGWGEVSEWPAERVEAGDWSAAAFRSPDLADAAVRIANDERMPRLHDQEMLPAKTGPLLAAKFKMSTPETPGSFPVLNSKGADAQIRIQAEPDQYWIPKEPMLKDRLGGSQEHLETEFLLRKAGHLMVTFGQRTSTARLTATASNEKFVGAGWMPMVGVTFAQAKAAAAFLNSTIGRLQLLRNPGKALDFPTYNPAAWGFIRCPDLSNDHVVALLADCWRRTAHMKVPQFRDGECEVRRLWDEAVADAMGWDPDELAELRQLLHREPHVRGLGYNQYG